MKKYILIFTVVLLFLGCERDKCELCACGVNNPATELQWLVELIDEIKAEPQKYMGSIYLGEYKGSNVFVSDLGISGAMYDAFYNCDGSKIVFETNESADEVKIFRDKVIYTTISKLENND